MKPAAFRLEPAGDLHDAARRLAAVAGARAIAGGQSLGPMLNFRVVSPPALVPLAAIPGLRGIAEDGAHLTIGAGVTHAEIAAGLLPPLGPGAHAGLLPRIAEAIAYPAVRNRGTIGGSLCHADPAADWVTTLTALGAAALTYRIGPGGEAMPGRAIPLRQFIPGAFRNALVPGEILQAVRVPRLSGAARWGYYKACRKPGEFAHAMAAVLDDPERRTRRIVIGAVGGSPLVLEGDGASLAGAEAAIRSPASGLDRVQQQMQVVALGRAAAFAGWSVT
jgi:carbon-monoxide dehydrogenase medium subunit